MLKVILYGKLVRWLTRSR